MPPGLDLLFLRGSRAPLSWDFLRLAAAAAATAIIQGDQKTCNDAKLGSYGCRLGLQLLKDRREQPMALLRELALSLQTQNLPQKTQSRHQHELLPVDTHGEAESSFIEQLQNLNNVLARVRNSEHRWRPNLLIRKADSWTVNQRPDIVVDQRL